MSEPQTTVDALDLESVKQGVGTRLRDFRQHLRLSQDVLAKTLGASKRGIQDNESGKTLPGAAVLRGLHELGLNLAWLLAGEGPMLAADLARERLLDAQQDEAQWQVVKLALSDLTWEQLVSVDAFADADRFVRAYNKGETSASEVLREQLPTITVEDLRVWATAALRWRHRWENAPVRLAYSTPPAEAVKRRAAEASTLIDQPEVVAINRASLARYLAAVRPALEQNLMDRPTAASVVAELYSQDDPTADRPVLNLLTAVLRGVWRSQVENGAPVTGPAEEAAAIADICRQIGLQPDDQTKGLTRSAG
ncbi:hypothetical protein METUNv1_01793 [Methyloversatilis universalis FAM5]|uniref:HTH cro/C1-type domain-containing protein n=1 Tax=Methyloversatilis universalis (strain ATCC BAA-1314 / DSM 25237 / JCM 13912 / CCUG 52030 / FAM5) TaxID=1000565 RepID=F5RBZ8_METUF|nr:helix-turn-helix transcriptional regulator [Methyloversatilis universalis]EGK72015.1 hypothetical protein METUNv1_01793 [Methyloversatilis universalis FAM5]